MNNLVVTAQQAHSFTFLKSTLGRNSLLHFDITNQSWHSGDAPVSHGETITVIDQALSLKQIQLIIHHLSDYCEVTAVQAAPNNHHVHLFAVVMHIVIKDNDGLRDAIAQAAITFHCELGLQRQKPSLSQPGLLVMDMDSTVIQIECIDEIAKLAGRGEEVAEVTKKAMRGELAFSESLVSRVACLEGVEVSKLDSIRDSIPLMPGIQNLVSVLQAHHWKVVIASGGFTYFADYVKERLDLDDAKSNVLDIKDGHLTGKVIGEIVDANVKARTVNELSAKWNIEKSQTIAMGDGANDLVMMAESALGVACHAKPLVNDKADVAIRYAGLDAMLLYLAQ